MTTGQALLVGFVAGVVVTGLPAFWWAVLRRAHADYRGAKASVPARLPAR